MMSLLQLQFPNCLHLSLESMSVSFHDPLQSHRPGI